MNNGRSQSIYTLDTKRMHRLAVRPIPLAPGESITLPHGLGKLTFVGYRQWASLAITYDPGQLPALISALTALAGLILSFTVRRRRLFIRAAGAADQAVGDHGKDGQPDGDGQGSVVAVGGLTRSDAAGGFETEFGELTAEIMQSLSGDGAGATARRHGGDLAPGARAKGE